MLSLSSIVFGPTRERWHGMISGHMHAPAVGPLREQSIGRIDLSSSFQVAAERSARFYLPAAALFRTSGRLRRSSIT
jgi:hypothetical protein